jgi:predicted aspartyl protease
VRGPSTTELPFLQTEPLPVVEIGVEGRRAYAFIDTGGAELILGTELAAQVGATVFGYQDGRFAGGTRADFGQGRVESAVLGDFEVRRVPVHILPTRRFSKITKDRFALDAVIGTNLLAQFRSTLDYAAGRLILERRENAPRAITGTEVPFAMLRDHYMVCEEGWLNGVGPLRFLVDSGLAGGAFTCPASTLERAGIAVPAATQEGIGGGGAVSTAPFVIEVLGLGRLRRRGLTGIYIEPAPGARQIEPEWDGIISHGFLRAYRWTIDPSASKFVFA